MYVYICIYIYIYTYVCIFLLYIYTLTAFSDGQGIPRQQNHFDAVNCGSPTRGVLSAHRAAMNTALISFSTLPLKNIP